VVRRAVYTRRDTKDMAGANRGATDEQGAVEGLRGESRHWAGRRPVGALTMCARPSCLLLARSRRADNALTLVLLEQAVSRAGTLVKTAAAGPAAGRVTRVPVRRFRVGECASRGCATQSTRRYLWTVAWRFQPESKSCLPSLVLN
jgi:hypothetical protein